MTEEGSQPRNLACVVEALPPGINLESKYSMSVNTFFPLMCPALLIVSIYASWGSLTQGAGLWTIKIIPTSAAPRPPL